MNFSAPFARLSARPSVRPSVRDKSEYCEKVRDRPYYGEPIGSHHWATQGTHLQCPTTTPSPHWGLTSLDRALVAL